MCAHPFRVKQYPQQKDGIPKPVLLSARKHSRQIQDDTDDRTGHKQVIRAEQCMHKAIITTVTGNGRYPPEQLRRIQERSAI